MLLPGPWVHRDASANGVRLHLAEAGEGPLVLLLHGFPQYWWTWRAQLPALADAGFRAVAPDLRGYGASDKPPRGYDLPTAASDAAALVRALGERDAVVVGHDWGALVAWTMAALHPRSVRRLVVVSMAHPRLLRAGLADRAQRRALRHVLGFQVPRWPEHRLTRADDDPVAEYLRRWAGPAWTQTADFAEAVERYRSAARIPQAAYGSMEYFRWAGRSQLRPDGLRYARRMASPVTAPTLQLHGTADPLVLPRTARGSGRYVAGAYAWRELPGTGHFPPEETPADVTDAITTWAQ
ncbi:Pimeloyl-ACP methyl ester carboxylesterase [Geodermatophilus dictyosporus]|uniref:Pimeloyl-ACP methyl ester carboxylesterase n=1 Tax=Geodermatophilus dictyosporus TaxID=1523247 RepID=A0A1I5N415_9ACTN|nr:alpha/beta hydrolase [Geodermatophilus dictyosporus]SFP16503.1 Pimeloyl-ACP methyl ester carboxylesterase [Geodermatophilus dictyosporus]